MCCCSQITHCPCLLHRCSLRRAVTLLSLYAVWGNELHHPLGQSYRWPISYIPPRKYRGDPQEALSLLEIPRSLTFRSTNPLEAGDAAKVSRACLNSTSSVRYKPFDENMKSYSWSYLSLFNGAGLLPQLPAAAGFAAAFEHHRRCLLPCTLCCRNVNSRHSASPRPRGPGKAMIPPTTALLVVPSTLRSSTLPLRDC